jgi:hypothetical protein
LRYYASTSICNAPSYIYHDGIALAYWGSSMQTRNNEFLNVAMHEICHAMGVDHSALAQTLMYPTYQFDGTGVPKLYFLTYDDARALQSLYGTVPVSGTPGFVPHRYYLYSKMASGAFRRYSTYWKFADPEIGMINREEIQLYLSIPDPYLTNPTYIHKPGD